MSSARQGRCHPARSVHAQFCLAALAARRAKTVRKMLHGSCMTSTNPLHEPPGPKHTPRHNRATASMAMVVSGMLLAFIGFSLTMLMMPYALVLSVIGIGIAVAGLRNAKQDDTR